ncbi:SIMPL domain-containing protein [Williamwhitmania taraxaci]|uniref:SIMPL domain-containing protein n=1 Tax=Williamwhitmania taraxaci TaxID=1640674 RepID=A0A1G6I0J6_9BACT|nr:SIMPL domain-containing protein [Williamwhitmania taraxaci]SDB99903.1 hypothetical protein SAMN05216323_101412 [Williamwhitmania taraxaci]
MKKYSFLAAAMLFTTLAIGQVYQQEKPYIEVTGIAKMEVVPDQIYLRIMLKERNESRGKISIERLETDMKGALKRAGIDIKNLSLQDAESDLTKISRRKQDVLISKTYQLVVSDAKTVSSVVDELGKIEITDLNIVKVSHSLMETLRKDVRIQAMKAAKTKAEYLLDAIGEKAGAATMVVENSWMENMPQEQFRSKEANVMMSGSEANSEYELSFSKITLEARMQVRFAIEGK